MDAHSPSLARVDALLADLGAMRPLDADQVGRAMQRLRLEWTYHSNAIEGNSLTYGETVALLMHGVTAQGKPLKDHLDIRGHREALDYLEALVQKREPLTLAIVRELHKVLLGDPYEAWAETPGGVRVRRTITPGQFKTQPNHVVTQTGETHYYARPEEVEPLMQELLDDVRETTPLVDDGDVHAVAFAAEVHHRLAAIHPFDDGNGRMARLLMNLVLMRAGYVPAVLRQDRRPAYYGALAAADAGDRQPLVEFVARELAETMELYVRALRGEPDPSLFAKRVALLKRQAGNVDSPEFTPEKKRVLSERFVLPLVSGSIERLRALAPLFGTTTHSVHVRGFDLSISDDMIDVADQAALDMIAHDDWRLCEVRLAGGALRADPRVDVWTSFKIEAGNFLVRLELRDDVEQWGGNQIPGEAEVAEALDQLFNPVLDRISESVERANSSI
jgi:Fic family protein